MLWLVLLLVVLLSVPACAQKCLGIDPAPPQAVAAGYTCQTYRWGTGDTISEIDTAQTYAPGFKWYYGTHDNNGHVTVGSDFTVQAVTGKIITQTAVPADHGAFVLNTCGAPAIPAHSFWNVGQFFIHGYYAEFAGEWNNTGHAGIQTGFYGLAYNGTSFPVSGQLQWEMDLPDAYADDQELVAWATGGFQGLTNGGGFVRHGDATVQTGDKFGVLSTATAVTWWFNDGANGNVDFSSLGGFYNPSEQYNTPMCFGSESTAEFPLTIDSFKVWQVGPAGGSGRRLKH